LECVFIPINRQQAPRHAASAAAAAARAAAGAAAPTAAAASSSQPIMASMATGPETAAAVESTLEIEFESTPTAEKAMRDFLNHLHTEIQAQTFNIDRDVHTMLLK
jgi:hypothetical protein